MGKKLTIFIGFIHDFAAGCWAATVLVIYLLARYETTGEVAQLINNIQQQFFYISLVFVFLVILTGAGRTFTYVDNVYGEEAENSRRKMLILKHIVLFMVFGLGIWWQYILAF